MTRTLLPLSVADISVFAKSLKAGLDERHVKGDGPPSHLELLNLLARAAGLRNFQTLKASAANAGVQGPPPPIENEATNSLLPVPGGAEVAEAPPDYSTLTPTVRKALMQFDTAGRLVRLPNKLSVQQMAMWWMWTQFTVRRKYTEKEVNQILNAHHTFGDQATLRRELVNMKLLGRKSDCSEYWKEPMRPNAEIQGFLKALRRAIASSQPTRALTALKRT
jgi:hypothetical protein